MKTEILWLQLQQGRRAVYGCVNGYKFPDGVSGSVYCVANGTHAYWDRPIPSCERKRYWYTY